MKKLTAFLLITALLALPVFAQKGRSFAGIDQLQSPQGPPPMGIIIHGGAGVIERGSMTPEKEAAYRAELQKALLAGWKVLQDGGTSLDAVQASITIMEDSPLFNAGKGAVFNAEGKNELDSAIMDGKTLKAGAVAGLHHIKNPILLARAVMDKSPHVMMIGDGAEKFAQENGFELVPEKYFWTQERWDGYLKVKKEQEEKAKQPAGAKPVSMVESSKDRNRYGTVGAAALDKFGNLAAGTSTGGITYKKYGRVGDAPIIGAGTLANNNTLAISATGDGEYFIRLGVARDISAMMEYQARPIQDAADTVMQKKLTALGGSGGMIGIDRFGNMAISFNSKGMYRAYIDKDGKPVIAIYKDEQPAIK
jgi:beta-aspartyl-peptidase (threonine type)